MTDTNTFFTSNDDEVKKDDDLGFEIEEEKDLLFDTEEEKKDKVDDVKDYEEVFSEEHHEIFELDSEEIKENINSEKSADLEDKKTPVGTSEDRQDESVVRDSDNITLSKSKITLIKKLLQNSKESNDKIVELLSVFSTDETDRAMISQMSDDTFSKPREDVSVEEGNIIEGVFDGETMVGPDGKEYSIPANYASKSKLVEGDILKLTILNNGTFIYKQIGPIDRDRIIGKLENGSNGQFIVTFEGKKWRVLTASVTYFKGSIGDEVIILVPKNADSQWAAVDNIVRNKEF